MIVHEGDAGTPVSIKSMIPAHAKALTSFVLSV